jgi:hypothetical protein
MPISHERHLCRPAPPVWLLAADGGNLRQAAGAGAAGTGTMSSALNRAVLDVSAYQDTRDSGLIPRHPPAPRPGPRGAASA